MKMRSITSAFVCLLVGLVGCQKQKELITDETRELTTLDQKKVDLTATSQDRFEMPLAQTPSSAPTEASFTYTLPEGWEEQAASMFRQVNLSLPNGGECYVSTVGGSLLANVNRWFGQFGQDKITQADLDNGLKITLFGQEAYVVITSGTYNSGMGKPPKENTTLHGAITNLNGGLITIKMLAPTVDAETDKAAFEQFCLSLSHK